MSHPHLDVACAEAVQDIMSDPPEGAAAEEFVPQAVTPNAEAHANDDALRSCRFTKGNSAAPSRRASGANPSRFSQAASRTADPASHVASETVEPDLSLTNDQVNETFATAVSSTLALHHQAAGSTELIGVLPGAAYLFPASPLANGGRGGGSSSSMLPATTSAGLSAVSGATDGLLSMTNVAGATQVFTSYLELRRASGCCATDSGAGSATFTRHRAPPPPPPLPLPVQREADSDEAASSPSVNAALLSHQQRSNHPSVSPSKSLAKPPFSSITSAVASLTGSGSFLQTQQLLVEQPSHGLTRRKLSHLSSHYNGVGGAVAAAPVATPSATGRRPSYAATTFTGDGHSMPSSNGDYSMISLVTVNEESAAVSGRAAPGAEGGSLARAAMSASPSVGAARGASLGMDITSASHTLSPAVPPLRTAQHQPPQQTLALNPNSTGSNDADHGALHVGLPLPPGYYAPVVGGNRNMGTVGPATASEGMHRPKGGNAFPEAERIGGFTQASRGGEPDPCTERMPCGEREDTQQSLHPSSSDDSIPMERVPIQTQASSPNVQLLPFTPDGLASLPGPAVESPQQQQQQQQAHQPRSTFVDPVNSATGNRPATAAEQELYDKMKHSFGVWAHPHTPHQSVTSPQSSAKVQKSSLPSSSLGAAAAEWDGVTPVSPIACAHADTDSREGGAHSHSPQKSTPPAQVYTTNSFSCGSLSKGHDPVGFAAAAATTSALPASVTNSVYVPTLVGSSPTSSCRGLDCGSNRYAALATRRHTQQRGGQPQGNSVNLSLSLRGHSPGGAGNLVRSITLTPNGGGSLNPSFSAVAGSARLDESLGSPACLNYPGPFPVGGGGNSFARYDPSTSVMASSMVHPPHHPLLPDSSAQLSACSTVDMPQRAGDVMAEPGGCVPPRQVSSQAMGGTNTTGPFELGSSGGGSLSRSPPSMAFADTARFASVAAPSQLAPGLQEEVKRDALGNSDSLPFSPEEGGWQQRLDRDRSSLSFASNASRRLMAWASGAFRSRAATVTKRASPRRRGTCSQVSSSPSGAQNAVTNAADNDDEDRLAATVNCARRPRASLLAASTAEELFFPSSIRDGGSVLLTPDSACPDGARPERARACAKDKGLPQPSPTSSPPRRRLGTISFLGLGCASDNGGVARKERQGNSCATPIKDTSRSPTASHRHQQSASRQEEEDRNQAAKKSPARGTALLPTGGIAGGGTCNSASETRTNGDSSIGSGGEHFSASRSSPPYPTKGSAKSHCGTPRNPFPSASSTASLFSRGPSNGRANYYGGDNQLADFYSRQLYQLFRTPPSLNQKMRLDCFLCYTQLHETCGKGIPWEAIVMLLDPADAIALGHGHRSLHLLSFDEFVELVEMASLRHARWHFQNHR